MIRKDKSDLIEIDGEYYSQKEIIAIIESNNELAKKNERQANFIRSLKVFNKELTSQRKELNDKTIKLSKELRDIKQMSMWEFADKYCNDSELEDAGKAFARSLGVGMSSEEVAIEEAENSYVPYSGDDF